MIEVAVFPVGGMGTRFLPATKTVPKEMLPVVDRPLLQYAVDEALEAGIRQMVFVTARGKSSLEDYFDVAGELTTMLNSRAREAELAILAQTQLPPGSIAYVRQQEPAGLGHAVWCARHIVGNRPFAVILPDDLVQGQPGCLKQMVDAYASVGGNLVAADRVPRERTGSYGIITPGATSGRLTEVVGLVEKPKPADAPSNLAVIGRYILQPEVMAILSQGKRGAGNEIQLTDAMAQLIGKQPFHGLAFDGVRHDCGDKAGHVIANIAYALERADVGPAVRAWLAANPPK
ncbi:MAG: UTP--glucose-1-phosphate uridylyltransferase [Sandarakinorhabdus sp.]|nr:UTP--glucose-1-phosphate uridylyltransferase [Sandarakinorhabdus sp.]